MDVTFECRSYSCTSNCENANRFNGSYKNLEGGTLAEALQDFTGGLCEQVDLKEGS